MICVEHLGQFFIILHELKWHICEVTLLLGKHLFLDGSDSGTLLSLLHSSAEIGLDNGSLVFVFGLLTPDLLVQHVRTLLIESLILIVILLHHSRVVLYRLLYLCIHCSCLTECLIDHFGAFVIMGK